MTCCQSLSGLRASSVSPIRSLASWSLLTSPLSKQARSFRLPAENQSSSCPTYLIAPISHPINVRPVPQLTGDIRYAVDQLDNPDSITLTHGGLFAPETLISGQIATASDTPMAKAIQSAFSNAISKLFTRVNAFYVGPIAAEMLARGCRLTFAVQSPPKYDLRSAPSN